MTSLEYTRLIKQAEAEGFVTLAMWAGIMARELGLTAEDDPFRDEDLKVFWMRGFLFGMTEKIPAAVVVPLPIVRRTHADLTHGFYA